MKRKITLIALAALCALSAHAENLRRNEYGLVATEELERIRDKYKKLHDEELLLPDEAEALSFKLTLHLAMGNGDAISNFVKRRHIDEHDWRRLLMHQVNLQKEIESTCEEGDAYCVSMTLLRGQLI
jgi:hypothetical protein